MGEDGELTAEEIRELARVFPPGPSAEALLHRAGVPSPHRPPGPPGPPGTASHAYWSAVADSVAAGRVADGRLRLLATACRAYPHNEVFRAAVREPGRGAVRRVLVSGAHPAGPARLRAQRELRAVQRAARGALTVDWCPARAVTDVRGLLTLRPDVLHLVCHGSGNDSDGSGSGSHGDGTELVFKDTRRGAHPVSAAHLAARLGAYRRLAGARLRGLVLSSRHGERAARLFTDAAAVVVAHGGPLDDASSVAFAAELYGLLGTAPALDEAARLAAERTATARNRPDLRKNLVVLRG